MVDRLVAAVETGGTKFRAAVVDDALSVVDSVRVPTTTAAETLDAVVAFFCEGSHHVEALGIAAFGPLDLDEGSPGYGAVGATPKPGWTGVPILGPLSAALGVPAVIQTDVEAAAVAEQVVGSDPRALSLAYVTVGTGIGAAVAVGGRPFRGRRHSELGHMPVRRADGDEYRGLCPYHGDCLEGLACGPAIAERWQIDPSEAADRDDVWDLEAYYLAQLVRLLAYSFAPDRIVVGGGVGSRPELANRLAAASRADLNGYADGSLADGSFIAAPSLGEDSGLLGAALLAQSAL